ncbi:hypothetical protein [Humisphaera borealis]|uniref:Uncharacterized protein n=1 Tax=Humisphaera borealis TaxID=2807512 RepID=A0A7M2WWF7_9BACT|nr:hypothetical protein [Humisphaera borealis]QOV89654.1 hypothetical protein IPV69_26280 [Humisphaera borealis]
MFKLIILAFGFVLGGGTGLWLSVNQPELAAKLFQKQNELIEEGKRQAIEEIKTRLDQIVAKEEAKPKPPGNTIMGVVAGMSGASPEGKTEIKSLQADLGKQLTDLGGPSKK